MNQINVIIIVLSVFFVACKDDPQASSSEEAYWQDYESPEHKWGFIDKNGKVVIPPVYDDVRDMKQALTAANQKGKWGFIDLGGNEVIPFDFKEALDFNGDRTIVKDFQNNWLLIDKNGSIVDSLEFDDIRPYQFGMAPVIIGERAGLIDENAKFVLEPEWQSVSVLDARHILIRQGNLYGLADRQGQLILDPQYKRIKKIGDHLVVKHSDDYKILQSGGYKVIGQDFQSVESLQENGWLVKRDNAYEHLSMNCDKLNQFEQAKVRYAGSSLLKFQENGKWGLMDLQGEVVHQASMDLLNLFKDERIGYMRNEKWGYLDTQGEVVSPPVYELIWDYHDGLARIIGDRGVGFIDKSGNLSIPEVFIEVRDFYNGKARFQTY